MGNDIPVTFSLASKENVKSAQSVSNNPFSFLKNSRWL